MPLTFGTFEQHQLNYCVSRIDARVSNILQRPIEQSSHHASSIEQQTTTGDRELVVIVAVFYISHLDLDCA